MNTADSGGSVNTVSVIVIGCGSDLVPFGFGGFLPFVSAGRPDGSCAMLLAGAETTAKTVTRVKKTNAVRKHLLCNIVATSERNYSAGLASYQPVDKQVQIVLAAIKG
jgi:hypothetical protein